MNVITDSRCTGYHRLGHPERPQRIARTLAVLKSQTDFPIEWLEPLPVTDEQILRAHAPELLASLAQGKDFDADTPAHEGIEGHARRSAGAGLQALRCAREGRVAFSLMRPPGHHATRDQAMGFCYLNNIAIAALEGQSTGYGKVAVLDFDVHHGNGTEDIFLDREGLAFFSIHQSPAYPGTGLSHRGTNCFNYPVAPDSPPEVYRAACQRAIEQLKLFGPDLVAVSAGFDAYRGDPLCQQTMEAADFRWLGDKVRELGVPAFSLLEGGYSNDLGELVLAYLRGLTGK